jgi:lipopolysaccharide/colanic/teichoic acid biosynthesis glycosyltransferase
MYDQDTRLTDLSSPPLGFDSPDQPFVHPTPLLPAHGISFPTAPELVARRSIDIAFSVTMLLLAALPMLAIAALVKLTSDGPVLFHQERVGRFGSAFRVFKFRTMVTDAEATLRRDPIAFRRYQENGFKLGADDPRITRLGLFLRRSSLDELPQLFNVLNGQMSVVGIRPLLPDEVALRSQYDQMLYRRMRPGLTGLWQVAGRSRIQENARVELDRRYIEGWSVASDLAIIARTPLALLAPGTAH